MYAFMSTYAYPPIPEALPPHPRHAAKWARELRSGRAYPAADDGALRLYKCVFITLKMLLEILSGARVLGLIWATQRGTWGGGSGQ